MKKKIKLLIKRVLHYCNNSVEKSLVLNAKLVIDNNNLKNKINKIEDVEFQVFSQNGEDGIIQYIINKIPIPYKIFIEFGVETYLESNTRFLLTNNQWSGLLIEADNDFINFIKKSNYYQKYDLSLKKSFITKENINQIINEYTAIKDIGLLSIDIDGNDYWIWETINAITPRIVILEYNATFGNKNSVSIPYNSDFSKDYHYSELYFGCSLQALIQLGIKKGYEFIGTESSGTNAFFVRKDLFNLLNIDYKEFNYLKAKSSRDKKGNLTFKNFSERIDIIKDEKIVDLTTNSIKTIKELYEL